MSPVTAAWKLIAGWLTDVARAFDHRAPAHVVQSAGKVKWIIAVYSWNYLGGECTPKRFDGGCKV